MGKESPTPTPSQALEPPRLWGALAWQEAAVSSELFPAGKAPLGGGGQQGFPWHCGLSGGAPRPQQRATDGVWLPLSKHRGMMWSSFDSGTGGLGQIPGSHEVR